MISKFFRSIFFTVDGQPPRYKRDGTKTVYASLLSMLAGIFIGSLLILIVGIFSGNIPQYQIGKAIELLFFGIFENNYSVNIGDTLFRATPIILTGLSVAVAFKTGLFNIGAPGQYLAGTCATLYIALSIPSSEVPAWIIWFLAFLGGILAGALWGAIPGALKAFLNINEVLACIMTNWMAACLVSWAFDGSPLRNIVETKTQMIMKTGSNGVATSRMGLDFIFPGSQVDGGIFIAAAIAVVIYIVMEKTVFGYELKACGANKHAAQYAGIKSKRNIVLSMSIAGALSGCAAALYFLQGNTEFMWETYQKLPAVGFNGIPVALLAANNPIAVVFSGIFMSALSVAGTQIKNLTDYNEYLTDIIIAAIVYFSAFSLVIRSWISGRKKPVKPALTAIKTPSDIPEPDAAEGREPGDNGENKEGDGK